MKDARRIALAVAGALATVLLLFGVLVLINADAGFEGCTAMSPFGWLAPLLAGSVIGATAWALLGERRAGHDEGLGHDAVPCSACGREVLGQWRMCPYCGAMLDRSPHRHALPEAVGEQ